MTGAFAAGADAVYLGGTRFGARAYADNFDEEQTVKAIHYAHLHGKKIYMTINTLVKEQEIALLGEFVQPYADAGLDGAIVQDFGVACYLREHFPEKTVYPVGTRAFVTELESYGIPLGEGDVAAVCVGFDTELVYEKLDRAVHYLRRGAAFIAANPDRVCPMPKGEVLPDCGSICALLTAAAGVEPTFIGKPNRNMVDIIAKQTGVPNQRICCVGDRLYTDIAVAQNAGAVSVCVLSGETSPEMIAAAVKKPDYVLRDVKELAEILRD